MIILIDNGHGENTSGKCSPDGRHKEWKWARDFAAALEGALRIKGYDARRIVTEATDVSIKERCRRVNAICKTAGAKNVLLVSIHNNAAGSEGKWLNARGFSSHVSLNASERSKMLATNITQSIENEGIKIRKPMPKQWYWPQNLGICRDTNCAAVLTENLFQDNREDVELLHNEEFFVKLCNAHVRGIETYIKQVGT
ncbi:MAG: N-acetylmuramoyl-L-alanine amidase [Bacteroidaceae bacterium]|nr:N-acetylmuramoyl-L-alanine amidase [Bacteroidaceae bacterium]